MRLFIHIFIFFVLASQVNISEAQKKGKEKKEKAQHAEYEFSEGMKFFVLGQLPEALSHFEASEKLGGENAAVYYMMARIYSMKEKPDLAIKNATKAIKLDSKNKYYYLLLAEIYENQRNFAEAIKTYKKLIAEVPHSEEYYYNLSDIYYFQQDYTEALKTYDKIDDVFGKSLPVTQRKQEIYVRQGQLPKAIEEGEALIKTNPDEADFKTAQAEFLFKNKMVDKAIAMMEEVVKAEPENSYARLLLADMYQAVGKGEKSEKELESVFDNPETDLDTKLNIISGYLKAENTAHNRSKALKLSEVTVKAHPKEAKAHAVYGEALRRSGQKDKAWESFITSVNLNHSNYAVWLEVLALDADLNKADSLIKHSETALETFPNQAVLWLYNGIGYSLKKNYSKSVDALEEGKKLAANNKELQLQFNLQLADNYYYEKNYSKSDAAFDAVLKQDEDNEHALNNYSYFLSLRKEKLDQAKTMGEKLVRLQPNEASYLDTYAWVLYQMKNYQDAKTYLEKAIANSSNGTIVEHYGDALFQLGEKDKAVEQWKKAKQLGETSDKIDKKIADRKLYE